MRKGLGDLEGGSSSSVEMEARFGRRQLQKWTWRTGLGGRRCTLEVGEEQYREEEEAPVEE